MEDDRDISMVEEAYLEAAGFRTVIIDNGAEVSALLQKESFDLILLDLMLPGKSGYEVCREIRDRVDIPILMVTARTESVDKIRGLGLGADDYIAKPFDPAELVARVTANIRQYERMLQKLPEQKTEEPEELRKMPQGFNFTLIGLVIVVGIAAAHGKSGAAVMDLAQFSVPLVVKLFLIGMIAISAMFFPGISGSTLLLIFGAYIPVITAIKGVLSLDFSYIPGLMFFGCGILAGAATVVKAIRACLERFRAQTIYLVLGMMIGSLYAIGMGPTTLEIPQAPLDIGNFSFVPALIGVVLVSGMQKIKDRTQKRVLR